MDGDHVETVGQYIWNIHKQHSYSYSYRSLEILMKNNIEICFSKFYITVNIEIGYANFMYKKDDDDTAGKITAFWAYWYI